MPAPHSDFSTLKIQPGIVGTKLAFSAEKIRNSNIEIRNGSTLLTILSLSKDKFECSKFGLNFFVLNI